MTRESRFYISLEDDLMRLFGSGRMERMVDALGLDENQPIEAKLLSNAIESAQKKIEESISKDVKAYWNMMML